MVSDEELGRVAYSVDTGIPLADINTLLDTAHSLDHSANLIRDHIDRKYTPMALAVRAAVVREAMTVAGECDELRRLAQKVLDARNGRGRRAKADG